MVRVDGESMTIQELDDALEKEFSALEAKIPGLHQLLGERFLWNQNNPDCWSVQEKVQDVKQIRDRQQEINNLRDTLARETRKLLPEAKE